MELREISLGLEAIRYIQQTLQEGKTLAKFVSRRLDLERGRVVTFLPPEVNQESAEDFRSGGKLARLSAKTVAIEPIASTLFAFIPIIRSFLAGGKQRLC